jgi:hypothetical protein
MARERSPNYPAYGLPSAIQFAKMVWDQEKRTAVEMEVIARALGSESVSGPVRSKVAAMRQYGLLQSVNGKLKVSDRAITLILQKPGQPDYDQAAAESAIAPSLFAELAFDKPDASDEALNFYLVRDLKFSTDGAKRLIRSYRETTAFAKLENDSYTTGDAPKGSEPPLVIGQGASSQRPPKTEGVGRVSFVFALPRGVSAEVIFHGTAPTKRAVEKLRAYLELFADDLPEDTPEVTPPPKSAALPPGIISELADAGRILLLERENRMALEDLNAEQRRNQPLDK